MTAGTSSVDTAILARASTRQTVHDMSNAPKLTVEIIATSLHGKNPRTAMGRAMWERKRKLVREAAGNRCEICGGVDTRHPVEIHERYEYDETCAPPCQRVIGLIALCPDCHAVNHLARTRLVARQQGDPSIYENALRHLASVNDWGAERIKDYLAEVQEEFQRREALGEWTQDFTLLLGTSQADHLSAGFASMPVGTRSVARLIAPLGHTRVRSPATRHHKEQATPVIDQIRHDIQERLDQLLVEADKLRRALTALDPRSSAAPARKPPTQKPAPASAPEPKAATTKSAPAKRTSQPAARPPRRTAPGATKASVLAALAGGKAMTAGQVADKTGMARGTVSTTLSKLSKSGEVQKAERGYRLAPASG
jgi:DNA-binding transcriptional ArsR family regulator